MLRKNLKQNLTIFLQTFQPEYATMQTFKKCLTRQIKSDNIALFPLNYTPAADGPSMNSGGADNRGTKAGQLWQYVVAPTNLFSNHQRNP